MPTVAATPTAHIHLDAEGRAWIDKTNVKVIEVAKDKVYYDWSAEEMHCQHPNLSMAQIHAALTYYYDHKEQFDVQIKLDEEEVERMRAEAGESPVVAKLRAKGLLP